MNPVDYYKSLGWYVTSPYGPRTGAYAGFHRGVDFGGFPCGAPVQSPFDGVVTAAMTSGMGTWGNTVCVKISEEYTTLNAHLQKILVKEGQRVKRGDIIGLNGGTNHSGANYACHVHFEVQKNTGDRPWRGTHIDPATFSLEPPTFSAKFKTGDTIQSALTTSSVWIRREPGGQTVGQVAPSETVIVLNHERNGISAGGYNWFYIQADKVQGWVAENFFKVIKKEIITDANRDEVIIKLRQDVDYLFEYLKIRG